MLKHLYYKEEFSLLIFRGVTFIPAVLAKNISKIMLMVIASLRDQILHPFSSPQAVAGKANMGYTPKFHIIENGFRRLSKHRDAHSSNKF